ncbi:MAG: DUF938 domain-containing protein [Rhodospirillaceae bacterium]|nr:DUF938 domain-containing protein [Rhodospirillaceae bacterium]
MTSKLTPPAAVRNAPFLVDVLRRALPASGVVLEIASGSGYHAAAFAKAFPHLTWQPTDPDVQARASISAYVDETGLANIKAPLRLDVTQTSWPLENADAVVCINMIHISPWAATLALFAGAANILSDGAPLITYGPYIVRGDFIAESNVDFDRSLRAKNPDWGLREVDEITHVARRAGFALENMVPMPANNFTLVFRKDC